MQLALNLVADLRATVLAAREVGQDPTNRLSQLFPYSTTEDIRFRLLQRQRVDGVGAVRAYSTPPREIRRGGIIEVKGEIPAVSAITSFTESDLQNARLLAGIATSGEELQNDVDAAAVDVVRAVDNSYELLRGSVLATGKLTIDNGEVIQEADFGVPTENKPVAQIPWTDTENALVYDDLLAWQQVYIAKGLGTPTRLDTTQRVVSLIRRNRQIRELLATVAGGQPIVTLDALNAFLTSEGLPAITQNGINERTIEGQRVIPEGSFIWTSNPNGAAFGNTLLGTSETGLQLRAGGILQASEVPGIVVATYTQDLPVARFVGADSKGLPVLNVPEALFPAKVF